jgi:inorganic pyrophosphatase
MNAVVEMPAGTKYKYEVDKNNNTLILDRPLEVSAPTNYGFIPDTLAEDGDAFDVFIISNEPIPPLTKVQIEVVGMLICLDNFVKDDKFLAVVKNENLHYDQVNKKIKEIQEYLSIYKKGFYVLDRLDEKESNSLINKLIK